MKFGGKLTRIDFINHKFICIYQHNRLTREASEVEKLEQKKCVHRSHGFEIVHFYVGNSALSFSFVLI